MRPPRRLPSLSALRAFDAAAAHRSFKLAAAELFVTPTAISHQVRGLEAHLGLPLFRRLPRQLELTPAGEQLQAALAEGLDIVERAIASLMRPSTARSLTLTTNTGFAARWLLPRIEALRQACPRAGLRLNATDRVADLARGDADIAVRSGDGRWPSLHVEHLAPERYAPMCSPRLRLKRPADLARTRHIHFDWQSNAKAPASWARWYRLAGRPAPPANLQWRLSDETAAVLAVLAGEGVGLLSTTLMADELRAGLLVQPFGPALDTGSYWLAALPQRASDPAVQAVWQWFRENLAAGA